MYEMSETAADGPTEEGFAIPLSYRPRKAADVLELDMGDGSILYDRDSSLVHHLNPTASLVWALCEGDASIEALAEEIADEYELQRDDVEVQLMNLVGELDALGLLEDAGFGGRA